METIDLAELAEYQEDKETLNKFQRPYLAPSLTAIVVALFGFLLTFAEMQSSNYYRGEPTGFLDRIWFHFEGTLAKAGATPLVISSLPPTLFFAGLAAFTTVIFAMSRAIPVSCDSGQRMEKYWNATPDRPGDREIVYVDRASRTYFRRVFISTSGPR